MSDSPFAPSLPRVHLRHVLESDLPLIMRSVSDPAWRGEWQGARMTSPEQIRRRFADHAFSSEDNERLMVIDDEGSVIGDVVHFQACRYSTARELGWMVYEPAMRGQGYGTAAALALVDYLFKTQPVHRLSCGMTPGNTASIRVAERCGFEREGLLRGLVFLNGEHLDGLVYGMTRPQWQSRRKPQLTAL